MLTPDDAVSASDSADPEASAPAGPADAAPTASASRPSTGALWAWVRVLAGAVAFALALRVLVFEAYRIPSTSMEDTLLVGDFVLVSKLHYGARVLGHRLPGFADPGRGDVVVFNYPPDLTPEIARKTPYIKRIVAVPGDTLRIRAKSVEDDGVAVPLPRAGRILWELRGALPPADSLARLGLAGRVERLGRDVWVVSATAAQADALDHLGTLDEVEPYVRPAQDGSAAFPAARRWSLDDYGPLVVPRAGATIRLDDASWDAFRVVLERYEGHTTERTAEGFLIDGRPAETVTFTQDYYFVMGDSRDDSADSRTWGFVPFSHVIGRALGVYFSWDEASGRPRWGRIGAGVE